MGKLLFISGVFESKYSIKNPIKDDVALEYYRLEKIFEGDILVSGENRLESGGKVKSPKMPDVAKSLSEIIHKINEKNSDGQNTVSEEQFADELEAKLDSMKDLEAYALDSEPEEFRGEYTRRIRDLVSKSYDINPYFARKFFGNLTYQNEIIDQGMKLCYKKMRGELETIVISPGKQVEVEIQYRKIIEKMKGKINWFDRYFGFNTLEFLETCNIDDSVKNIKDIGRVLRGK